MHNNELFVLFRCTHDDFGSNPWLNWYPAGTQVSNLMIFIPQKLGDSRVNTAVNPKWDHWGVIYSVSNQHMDDRPLSLTWFPNMLLYGPVTKTAKESSEGAHWNCKISDIREIPRERD